MFFLNFIIITVIHEPTSKLSCNWKINVIKLWPQSETFHQFDVILINEEINAGRDRSERQDCFVPIFNVLLCLYFIFVRSLKLKSHQSISLLLKQIMRH